MKKNLLLLLAAIVVSFAAAEIICSIKGNYLSYNERTGAGGYTSPFDSDNRGWTHAYPSFEEHLMKRNEFTDSWKANEDGLKDENISPSKKGKRILVLGDSFTEGVGAPPDSSYPRILELLLQSKMDTSIQVINAGIGGSDIFFEYKMLLALFPKYKPDVVLVTCNASDIPEYLTRGGFERFTANGSLQYRNAPWFEPLYGHSLLVQLLVHDVFRYDFNFIRHEKYDEEFRIAEAAMGTAIDSFHLFCQANGLLFSMVFHPFNGEVQNPQSYLMNNLISHCQQKGITYTDELKYLKAHGITEKNVTDIYWQSDGHFNPKGYELLAHCVYELIKNQDWE